MRVDLPAQRRHVRRAAAARARHRADATTADCAEPGAYSLAGRAEWLFRRTISVHAATQAAPCSPSSPSSCSSSTRATCGRRPRSGMTEQRAIAAQTSGYRSGTLDLGHHPRPRAEATIIVVDLGADAARLRFRELKASEKCSRDRLLREGRRRSARSCRATPRRIDHRRSVRRLARRSIPPRAQRAYGRGQARERRASAGRHSRAQAHGARAAARVHAVGATQRARSPSRGSRASAGRRSVLPHRRQRARHRHGAADRRPRAARRRPWTAR